MPKARNGKGNAGARKGNVYEVEKIVASRMQGNVLEYYVKWKGFPYNQNTWEPSTNLKDCKSIVAKYEAGLRTKSASTPSPKTRNGQEKKKSAPESLEDEDTDAVSSGEETVICESNLFIPIRSGKRAATASSAPAPKKVSKSLTGKRGGAASSAPARKKAKPSPFNVSRISVGSGNVTAASANAAPETKKVSSTSAGKRSAANASASRKVNFRIRWKEDREWKKMELKAGHVNIHVDGDSDSDA